MIKDKVDYIVGSSICVKPIKPYSEIVCDFLNELSIGFREDKEAGQYPDIMSLAFWCRKGNVKRLKMDYDGKRSRIGRGVVFHITPSNVPINFAFSYFFGLLSGNSNIVRIPSKKFPQVDIICRIINQILQKEAFKEIRDMTMMISYQRDDKITAYYSSLCDARIVWGGDEAINNIRTLPIKERAVEVVFADRYSICIINSDSILKTSEERLQKLAEQFFNDSYLMDQNACSTPFLVLWYGNNDKDIIKAKELFWEAVYQYAKKYDLTQIKVVDKYTQLCKSVIDLECAEKIRRYENILYVIELNDLDSNDENLRGRFGLFYEFNLINLSQAKKIVNKKTQTLTYYGMDKNELAQFVIENNLLGIDRIVPIGSALDMNVIWDGYDIIGTLSRIIDIK